MVPGIIRFMTDPAPGIRPAVAVIIATRNRPDLIEDAVNSVLAHDDVPFELLIVDQSDGTATADTLAKTIEADARGRYLATPSRGLSAARNVGIAATSAEIVCFTDDDCRVRAGWLQSHLDWYERDDSLGAVFGPVEPPPDYDWSAGVMPVFRPPAATILRASRRRDFQRDGYPMGANMSLRRSALHQTGPFDDLLGPGAPFGAADDTDMLYRLLSRGYGVAISTTGGVLHLGGRDLADGSARRLMVAYCLGLGGFVGKHARCGDANMLAFGAVWLARQSRDVLGKLMSGDRPLGVRRISAYLEGLARAMRYRVDRRRRLFVIHS